MKSRTRWNPGVPTDLDDDCPLCRDMMAGKLGRGFWETTLELTPKDLERERRRIAREERRDKLRREGDARRRGPKVIPRSVLGRIRG